MSNIPLFRQVRESIRLQNGSDTEDTTDDRLLFGRSAFYCTTWCVVTSPSSKTIKLFARPSTSSRELRDEFVSLRNAKTSSFAAWNTGRRTDRLCSRFCRIRGWVQRWWCRSRPRPNRPSIPRVQLPPWFPSRACLLLPLRHRRPAVRPCHWQKLCSVRRQPVRRRRRRRAFRCLSGEHTTSSSTTVCRVRSADRYLHPPTHRHPLLLVPIWVLHPVRHQRRLSVITTTTTITRRQYGPESLPRQPLQLWPVAPKRGPSRQPRRAISPFESSQHPPPTTT